MSRPANSQGCWRKWPGRAAPCDATLGWDDDVRYYMLSTNSGRSHQLVVTSTEVEAAELVGPCLHLSYGVENRLGWAVMKVAAAVGAGR